MRPGDVHTHVFAQQFPIVQPDGSLYDHLWQARERGVLFDLGHGGASFWFRNAVPAISAGFPPDSISTDLHLSSLNGAALDTLHTVSKCIAMGMPLREAIYRTTVTRRARIRRAEQGTLSEGWEADVAVLRWIDSPRQYVDCGRARLTGPGRARVRHDAAGRAHRVGPERDQHAGLARRARGLLERPRPPGLIMRRLEAHACVHT